MELKKAYAELERQGKPRPKKAPRVPTTLESIKEKVRVAGTTGWRPFYRLDKSDFDSVRQTVIDLIHALKGMLETVAQLINGQSP
jgi:hypothetical protein